MYVRVYTHIHVHLECRLDTIIYVPLYFFCRDLYDRAILDDYLARALNIELENKRLSIIDKSNYVLTLDYTIKMLNIHERYVTFNVHQNYIHTSALTHGHVYSKNAATL